jgi:hypothetical protein
MARRFSSMGRRSSKAPRRVVLDGEEIFLDG